jgi:hypothetical protein
MKICIKKRSGTEKVLDSINQNVDVFQRGIRRALIRAGRENVRHTRKLILDKNKNGRIYLFRGQPHQASAPGEAPANMSGTLQKTMKYDVRGHQQMEFGDTVIYGKYLEEGTDKIAKRPHLSRTVKEKARDNQTTLGEYVKMEIDRAAT